MKTQTQKFLFGGAKGKAQIVARIAIMLTATIVVQYLTGLANIQLLTGSFVNLFLLLSTLLCGFVGGVGIGLVTPFIALAVGLNPNILLVPFIALSNAILVTIYSLVCKFLRLEECGKIWEEIAILVVAFVLAASLKFVFMFFVCANLIFPLLFAPAVVAKLSVAWGILQLATASIGGAVTTALYFPLKRIRHLGLGQSIDEEQNEIEKAGEPEEKDELEEPQE